MRTVRQAPVRVAKVLGVPADEEVEERNAIHLPHRSWCPICVKARGKMDGHRKVTAKGEKPIISMDYKIFGRTQ